MFYSTASETRIEDRCWMTVTFNNSFPVGLCQKFHKELHCRGIISSLAHKHNVRLMLGLLTILFYLTFQELSQTMPHPQQYWWYTYHHSTISSRNMLLAHNAGCARTRAETSVFSSAYLVRTHWAHWAFASTMSARRCTSGGMSESRG